MSSFFQTAPNRDADEAPVAQVVRNPWTVALAVLSAVLIVGGVVLVGVGFGTLSNWSDTVLGQSAGFDTGVATAIVGGAAIVLGILVGTCWLVLGAIAWRREG